MQGKRVVVLGGAGFIGSHLCERLISDGASEVISVDNLATGSERNLAELKRHKQFRDVRHDISEAPIRIDGPVDFVLNLASPASPIDYARLWLETLRVGSIGTEHGLRLAEEKKAVFLLASTSEIYGDPDLHPQSETYFGNVNSIGPRAVYDEAKRYAEAITSGFARAGRVEARIARIFNTYGPRMRLEDGRVVPAFVGQALRGEDFTVFGDGSQTRCFCYVSDLVDGLVRLAQSNVREPVNLGNPREMTILQFLDATRAEMKSQGKVIFQPLPQDDPRRRQPDIRRAQSLLGWSPKVALEDGLRETVAYFRSVV